MNSYQGDPAFKRRFVRQIDAHRRADSVVQGLYGKMNGKFRGCAVGCSIHSLDRIDGLKETRRENGDGGYSDHAMLSERLGIPLTLAHLEDRIFEGLSPLLAREWPGRFSRAIPVGRDLSKVWPQFALWLLTDPKHGVKQYAKTDQVRAAIDGVARLYERELSGDKPTIEEWRAARSAAAAADARRKWYRAAADKLVAILGVA